MKNNDILNDPERVKAVADYARLVEEYEGLLKNNGSQHKLARLEQNIWEAMKSYEGQGATRNIGERRDWFHKRYKGPVAHYDQRASILSYGGPSCEDLFDRVDKSQVSLSTAAAIVRGARRLIRSHRCSKQAAYEAVIGNYDGTWESIDRTTIRSKKLPASKKITNKSFRMKVLAMADSLIRESLADSNVEEYQHERLITEFKEGMDALMKDLSRDISDMKHTNKEIAIRKIGEPTFNWACDVLCLSFEFGKEVDIQRVRRVARRRAADLHPDRNRDKPDSETRDEEYRRIGEAREILEQYAKKANGTRRRRHGSTKR
jgi:curved DNA-binding protein CbpA